MFYFKSIINRKIIPQCDIYNLFYFDLNKYIVNSSRKIVNLINILRKNEYYSEILDLMKITRDINKWVMDVVKPYIDAFASKKASKIQFWWRKYKIRDVRNFRFLSNSGKIQMALYATLRDSRSLRYLDDKIKKKISIYVWIIGIYKDARVYTWMPSLFKNDLVVGLFFAKLMISRVRSYIYFIPQHIQSIMNS
jgi:hypothetical protein